MAAQIDRGEYRQAAGAVAPRNLTDSFEIILPERQTHPHE
jgi:hypothetical protein